MSKSIFSGIEREEKLRKMIKEECKNTGNCRLQIHYKTMPIYTAMKVSFTRTLVMK